MWYFCFLFCKRSDSIMFLNVYKFAFTGLARSDLEWK